MTTITSLGTWLEDVKMHYSQAVIIHVFHVVRERNIQQSLARLQTLPTPSGYVKRVGLTT